MGREGQTLKPRVQDMQGDLRCVRAVVTLLTEVAS
jgi:hypothetical protein